jgi:hypothetical protein
MHFQPDDVTGILELEDTQDISDDMELCTDKVVSEASVIPLKPGGYVMWNDPWSHTSG